MIKLTVKMIFTFVLASALAMSSVLCRSSGPPSRYVTYETEDSSIGKSEETAQIMDVNDRSSNLKYVMAIQSTSIWEEIKKRSMTLYGPQKLDGTIYENSPDDLTDQELAQLKQACHDGLKCVAVDQLIVLEQVKEPLVGGKVSVRTAITKIIQVLTQFTTEYHEDVYQYETVSESDDESKVYELVTTIVEDNKELCRIDFTPPTEENNPNGKSVPVADNNNDTINYNTVNDYNINYGTINSASIEMEPSDTISVVESPDSENQSNNSPDQNLVIVIAPQPETADGDGSSKNLSPDDHLPTERTATTSTTTDGLTGDESVTRAPENDVRPKEVRQNYTRGSGTSDQHYEPVTTTDDNNTNANHHDSGHSDHLENNDVSLKNRGGNGQTGETDSQQNIVSAGSSNHGNVKSGYVEDGTLNNGNMVQYNINRGIINKGTITDSKAAIISVGTLNNGPVNYGTSDNNTNNGNQVVMNVKDIQQFLSNIDKMYSTIIERLG
ncbi:GATA zinc finger domain-containing protein 14-like [Myzus persicae]|uniref:GATA zinc finger domain-containing protein 14-like n=1 Tax=Myzus persicae TaxID=13164 RepID=UPI000B9353D9|nr:GATA zinc finger domain-containing protein 14-like [Myzus persicae]